jgi:hypothetical protein
MLILIDIWSTLPFPGEDIVGGWFLAELAICSTVRSMRLMRKTPAEGVFC